MRSVDVKLNQRSNEVRRQTEPIERDGRTFRPRRCLFETLFHEIGRRIRSRSGTTVACLLPVTIIPLSRRYSESLWTEHRCTLGPCCRNSNSSRARHSHCHILYSTVQYAVQASFLAKGPVHHPCDILLVHSGPLRLSLR